MSDNFEIFECRCGGKTVVTKTDLTTLKQSQTAGITCSVCRMTTFGDGRVE